MTPSVMPSASPCSACGSSSIIIRGIAFVADYAALSREEDKKVRRTLITPEGVDLSLKLGDAGQRLSAFLLDLIFMVLILVGLTLAVVLSAFAGGPAALQTVMIIWLL